jgi:predicted kinase
MTNKIIVGLAGLKGSGKDTAAKALVEDGFVNLKFADGIKNMLRALFYTAGVSNEETEKWIEGEYKETKSSVLRGKTPRFAMQQLGTEWGRQVIGDDLWTATLERAMRDTGKNVVVTDLRFPNERAVLSSYNAKLFKIERGISPTDVHESERYVTEMSIPVINNSGTVDDLHRAIRQAVYT